MSPCRISSRRVAFRVARVASRVVRVAPRVGRVALRVAVSHIVSPCRKLCRRVASRVACVVSSCWVLVQTHFECVMFNTKGTHTVGSIRMSVKLCSYSV